MSEDQPTPQPQSPSQSFGSVAQAYDRGRPGYPSEAVAWAVGGEARIVLELGSGTGKLTAELVRQGHAVHATEPDAADRFLRGVSSAVALWNASTQFCDGGEFGFGAEIGIATGRIHARGPVGVEQLTTFRYVVVGTGQVRP